jgi:hypothetical protein
MCESFDITWSNTTTSYASQKWAEEICRDKGDFGKPDAIVKERIKELLEESKLEDIDVL